MQPAEQISEHATEADAGAGHTTIDGLASDFRNCLAGSLCSGLSLRGDSTGFVYTMSNAGSRNSVLNYMRAFDGTLTPNGSYATGGPARANRGSARSHPLLFGPPQLQS